MNPTVEESEVQILSLTYIQSVLNPLQDVKGILHVAV